MSFNSIDELRQQGFGGFISVTSLQKSLCSDVPDLPGIYLVLNPERKPPDILEKSTGGQFKGKDPTVEISRLEDKWVDGALVVNIGKAGPSNKRTLKIRLKEYVQFGQGRSIGHRGGRYIWQLRGSGDLVICWKTMPREIPREEERRLIHEFEAVHGKLPFANLNR
jgi:hypothetical protein